MPTEQWVVALCCRPRRILRCSSFGTDCLPRFSVVNELGGDFLGGRKGVLVEAGKAEGCWLEGRYLEYARSAGKYVGQGVVPANF